MGEFGCYVIIEWPPVVNKQIALAGEFSGAIHF